MDTSTIIESGIATLQTEARALMNASEKLGEAFAGAVACIESTNGKLVCTGMGKSGHIANKIAATLASTGTPAFFLHPSEAMHGDLGMITDSDCLLAIAFGGHTPEVLDVCRYARRIGVKIIALTGKLDSPLADIAHFVLDGSVEEEACPLQLAPTSSSTLALALGDCLAVSLMKIRGFKAEEFAQLHPGGSLGRKLVKARELARVGKEFNTVSRKAAFFEVMEAITRPNFGIVAVVDEKREIIGAITDGDLRRRLMERKASVLEQTAEQLMSTDPVMVSGDSLAIDAFRRMEDRKVTSLFVFEEEAQRVPVGLLRMHDLLEKKIF